jgi:geranylgeranyl pyrophosphate synthase
MASMNTDLKSFLKAAADRTDDYLKECLDSASTVPPRLREAIAYSLLGSGKRIRPALVLLCHLAAGGGEGGGNDGQTALAPAAAIEMIHCFSLIHDDLPAMDNDDLRRGRPTNHKVFGDGLAILAGDALNTLAFETLVRKVADPQLAVALIRELAFATGLEGMIGGQVLDTCHPQEARLGNGETASLGDLQRIHRMKTGALIVCACRMGALCAKATPATLDAIDRYGRSMGLAFQIMDDILDVTASAEQMGKKTGKDAAIGKLTYPSLVGLDKSREYLAEQVRLAEKISRELGPQAQLLGELAQELATRTN